MNKVVCVMRDKSQGLLGSGGAWARPAGSCSHQRAQSVLSRLASIPPGLHMER